MFGIEVPLGGAGGGGMVFSCYTFSMAEARKNVYAQQQISHSICCLLLDGDA